LKLILAVDAILNVSAYISNFTACKPWELKIAFKTLVKLAYDCHSRLIYNLQPTLLIERPPSPSTKALEQTEGDGSLQHYMMRKNIHSFVNIISFPMLSN